jgi:hypothetical protein
VGAIDLCESVALDQLIARFRFVVSNEMGDGIDSLEPSLPDAPEQHDTASDIGIVHPSRNLSAPTEGLWRGFNLGEGQSLRASIFDPLVPALAGCTRLFLAPDGDLTRLPFEVLPLAGGRRLIDEYHISYLSSGRDILRFGALAGRQPTTPVVAASPDFDLRPEEPNIVLTMTKSVGRQSRDLDRGSLHFAPLKVSDM